jgi:hypothetical protein
MHKKKSNNDNNIQTISAIISSSDSNNDNNNNARRLGYESKEKKNTATQTCKSRTKQKEATKARNRKQEMIAQSAAHPSIHPTWSAVSTHKRQMSPDKLYSVVVVVVVIGDGV